MSVSAAAAVMVSDQGDRSTGAQAGLAAGRGSQELKVWFTPWRLLGAEAITAPDDVDIAVVRSRRTPLFRDHLAKHVLAAMSGD